MPARRYLCSPQGGGKLFLLGETLPAAPQGSAYAQDISGQAHSGVRPYAFSLLSSTGGDTWFVSVPGVISGTPAAQNLIVDENGNYVVDESGNYLST